MNSSRFNALSGHISNQNRLLPVLSSLDFCFFDDLLTPKETEFRKEVRTFAESEITPYISDYYERAEFPQPLFEKMGKKQWLKRFLREPYGTDESLTTIGLLLLEIARVDASMATTLLVHTGVMCHSIDILASEEQKKRLLPGMVSLTTYCGFGLTEPNAGSDVANLQTQAKKVPGGYQINGAKRWQGNSDRDMLVVWAINEEFSVDGFIVPIKSPGVKCEIIKNKLSVRCVQNANITLDNVFVSEENKLPNMDHGLGAIGEMLGASRVLASWIAVGIAVGVYDNTIKYLNNRTQFGVKLTSFQLIQEKLSRMMAHIQAVILLIWRVTRLMEKNKASGGISSMAKAWITNVCREVARLGREMMGGNGIIADNYVMKALVDMEAVFTYEGTYDINSLIVGKELTKMSALKARS